VPQRTVIGHLLFILYINDIIKNVGCVGSSTISLFADDTLLSISGDNIEDGTALMNEDLKFLTNWLNYNKLNEIYGDTNKRINNKEETPSSIGVV
jgi:hypothetical protein